MNSLEALYKVLQFDLQDKNKSDEVITISKLYLLVERAHNLQQNWEFKHTPTSG